MNTFTDKNQDKRTEGKNGDVTILCVKHVVKAQSVSEGAGVLVHRAFPTAQIDYLDPFLLLDEMGPTNFRPNTAKGFPDHPHKGFETVTYLLEGAMRHSDSAGNEGFLRPGDVQWMTAGRGIVHSEMPDPQFAQNGGLMHGFQLWVNLPRKDKLVPPRYQDLPAEKVPGAVSPDGLVTVKVIAGEALGVVAPIETHTKIMYLHFSLKPGASFVQPIDAGFNTIAYVIAGEANFAGPGQGLNKTARAGHLVIFERTGSSGAAQDQVQRSAEKAAVSFSCDTAEGMELLLIAGEPIAEPVARYGPFVMNTKAEILEAMEQYQNGQLGRIARQ